MRYDLFIVWGHGLQYLDRIMVELRYAFKIIMIYKHRIQDMEQFIDEIYSCDSYPLSHLREKTRYLLDTPQECLIILVKNSKVNEQMVGSGEFRKPQCMYLQGVKNSIRTRFNPPATQHHIIHGTDYESQVHHILDVVKQGPLSKYTHVPHRDIPYPWHIPKVKSYKEKTWPASKLKINVLGRGLVPIDDSPHYHYIKGVKGPYRSYFYKYLGWALREDHFPERFDQMIEQAKDDMAYCGRIVLDTILVNKDGQILDGGHRAALLRFYGHDFIKTFVI